MAQNIHIIWMCFCFATVCVTTILITTPRRSFRIVLVKVKRRRESLYSVKILTLTFALNKKTTHWLKGTNYENLPELVVRFVPSYSNPLAVQLELVKVSKIQMTWTIIMSIWVGRSRKRFFTNRVKSRRLIGYLSYKDPPHSGFDWLRLSLCQFSLAEMSRL